MLGLVKSCIGTKFTGQFGDLIAVSSFYHLLPEGSNLLLFLNLYLVLLNCLNPN